MKNSDKKTIDDKLYTVKTKGWCESHLKPDCEKCRRCEEKFCTFICPANVYSWDDEKQKLNVAYENCLECGACRIACEKRAIDWEYPQSGYGITFRHS